MITRTYLLQGDKASNGAVIIGGSTSCFYEGTPTAREGDQVYCPVCKQIGSIVCVGPRLSSMEEGKEEALSGDICVCGCKEPPVFYASRPYTMTMTGEEAAWHPGGKTPAFAATPSVPLGNPTHDQRIQILDDGHLLRPRGTLYWGGAGLDGDYLSPTARAFQKAGVSSFRVGLTNTATKTILGDVGMFVDALRAGLTIRYEDSGEWAIKSGMSKSAQQFNLIGYSYGSLLAAQTANFYASRGHVVDHLVLIGSPIDATFLRKLRASEHIRKVMVIDLQEHGDPIYAGISQLDLIAASPILAAQMKARTGHGHFYYADMTPFLPARLDALAARIVAEGVT